MRATCQRDGEMSKSKFDMSLLEPIKDEEMDFNGQLEPIGQDEISPENIEKYLAELPEAPGFFSKLPRNILIGLAHAGRNLHNAPHDIAQGLESGTSGFRDLVGRMGLGSQRAPISESLPYDTNSYAEAFGQKGAPSFMDEIIQKGLEYSPEIAGGAGVVRSGLRKFPITKKMASRKLREAEKLINERGLNDFQLSEELIREAAPFLPPTRASKEMIEGIMRGEYGPSFALQSQIGKHARDLTKSPLAAERLLAPKAHELKQKALSEIEMALRYGGHDDLADLIKGGIKDYQTYIKVKEKAVPALKKLRIPTTGLALLGFGTDTGRHLIKKIL